MPDLDEPGTPAAGRSAESESHAMSRRSMLRGTAGVGAAGLAVGALAGAIPVAAAATRTGTARRPESDAVEDPGEAVVVYVRDAAAGELEIYRGTSQIQIRDRALAAKIVRATR